MGCVRTRPIVAALGLGAVTFVPKVVGLAGLKPIIGSTLGLSQRIVIAWGASADEPVRGGGAHMVGATDEDFARAEPLLKATPTSCAWNPVTRPSWSTTSSTRVSVSRQPR